MLGLLTKIAASFPALSILLLAPESEGAYVSLDTQTWIAYISPRLILWHGLDREVLLRVNSLPYLSVSIFHLLLLKVLYLFYNFDREGDVSVT